MASRFVRSPVIVSFALSLGFCCGLAACGGASSNEATTARTAHYSGDKMVLFKALADAVKDKYPIDKYDNNALILETVGRWHTDEGDSVSERMDDIRDVPDKGLHIAYVVALVADGNTYVVDIKPKYYRYHRNSPKPEPLKEDDISLHGWVHGKLDAFAVNVHEALKQYEVSGAAAGAPAAAPVPSTPPASVAPEPAAPTAGSAQ
jgi:hypothetical protein